MYPINRIQLTSNLDIKFCFLHFSMMDIRSLKKNIILPMQSKTSFLLVKYVAIIKLHAQLIISLFPSTKYELILAIFNFRKYFGNLFCLLIKISIVLKMIFDIGLFLSVSEFKKYNYQNDKKRDRKIKNK